MILYKFMNPGYMKAKKDKIPEKIKEKYNINLSKELFEGDNTVLFDFLRNRISDSQYEEKLELKKADLMKTCTENQDALERVFKELENLVAEPANYYFDLSSAIYMGLLYNNPGEDPIWCIKNADKLKNAGWKKYINNSQKVIDEIEQIWARPDNKIDKEEVWENYPVLKTKKEYKDKIISLPGGFLDFHHVLISKEHIGIFDMKETNDYRRYSFGKIFHIYDELHNKYVENLLLMEYVLGIGYANQIYYHTRKIREYPVLSNFLDVVKAAAQIECFFIRRDIFEAVWKYIELCNRSADSIECAEKVLLCVKDIIHQIFGDTLQIWWYAYYLYANRYMLDRMCSDLERVCKQYFIVDAAYEDWIKFAGIHNWRIYGKVDDCFEYIPDFRFSKLQFNGKVPSAYLDRVQRLDMPDKNGNIRSLIVEAPVNEIGQDILERVVKEFWLQEYMETDMELYKWYYRKCEEVYTFLYEMDKELEKKKDIKISESNKTIKAMQVYAKVQKEVIRILLHRH